MAANLAVKCFVVFAVLALLAGCGGEVRYEISGAVTVDNQPVDKGVVRFESVDGPSQADEAAIEKGRYTGSVRPGKKRITVDARRIVGREHISGDPANPMIDKLEVIRIDASQPLEIEIKRGGAQHDLNLKSRSP